MCRYSIQCGEIKSELSFKAAVKDFVQISIRRTAIFKDEEDQLHFHAGRGTVGVGGRGLARADLPGVAGGGHLLLLLAHPLLLAHSLLSSC